MEDQAYGPAGGPSLPSPESLAWIEQMYGRFLEDPLAVGPRWRDYFDSVEPDARFRTTPSWEPRSNFAPRLSCMRNCGRLNDQAIRQDKVDQLVRGYRVRGHMIAHLDPIGRPGPPHPELEIGHYDLTPADLDRAFSSRTMPAMPRATLRQILEHMRSTYCRSIGAQYMHIDDLRTKTWITQRLEQPGERRRRLSRDEQVRILEKLTDAAMFEDFLQKKFLGAKRFSLEGAETLIPLLDNLICDAASAGVEELVIGMAHRGRLNVLANILHKSARQIFRELADSDPELYVQGGDVKYHLGHTADYEAHCGRTVRVSLCFNPSHLEFVDPVVMGRVRARQDQIGDHDRRRVLGVLIHGDAAFAGEGVVQETLNMSGLPGYAVGGMVHIVVNNQIGFTTPPELSRTSPYATCVAKLLQIPIFHVNGEQPEAVAQVVDMAMDFRSAFRLDSVVDMYCYRRYGHNEGDDPAYTQPVLYHAIRNRKPVRDGYRENLVSLGTLTTQECEEIELRRREHLDAELSASRAPDYHVEPRIDLGRAWDRYVGGPDAGVPAADTAVPKQRLVDLLLAQANVPADFDPHPKIVRLLQLRRQMAEGIRPLDFGTAEALAFASLLAEGIPVRMSGQDSGRGTFSHRHAVLFDHGTGRRHVPLEHLAEEQGPFEVWDSPLSENGPLGFELGYSLERPEGLVLWEAQFGDFANAAQVIIDQFIVACEDKWRLLSGLVLLLPHGFEGQGPEHSSARLERFLTMAAEDNIQVVNLTTPAQIFHCLRRQVLRPIRKPLVVMAPKSLLRHPQATSTLDELASGRFQRIIPDPDALAGRATRVLLCSGKIYYELVAERDRQDRRDVAIARLEQLYPLRAGDLLGMLEQQRPGTPVLWVQEEPLNQGAWSHLLVRHGQTIQRRHPFGVVARAESASPATGSAARHAIEQKDLLERAVGSSQ